jgi:hypothetical protein
MENKQVIQERNILKLDNMVAPLDFIAQMIQDNNWGYLYSCACLVYPRLVLAKIVLHNLWPRARRSELVLKRARFIYALVMRMPFCLCKHIL